MPLRVWISPVIVVNNASMAKAEQYCSGGFVNWFPTDLSGISASPWVITVGRATDWAAAIADTDLIDLFAGDLPANVDTVDAFKTFLRTRTVADVPLARRNAIIATLDAKGILHADIIGTTPLWKVFQRVISTLTEKDANFAAGFNF